MKHLLLLVHRMPYPPNKGDKIRSYHLLKHLAQRFHVHLGTFIDDPDDWQHMETVNRMCLDTHFARLQPFSAKLRSLRALPAARPMTIDYYRDAGMQTWIRKVLNTFPISRVVVFSSAMAQYAETIGNARRVIDFVDVDSDKWAQYAEKKSWPMNWLYRRESRTLLRYEREVAASFDASMFVSHAEAALFRQHAPECADKVGYFSNGVDTDFFSPERGYRNPYPSNEAAVVFTGAMDYWPNADAVQWFCEKVLHAIRVRVPRAAFYIVGARPTEQVKALAKLPGVRVTGTVADIRPYIAHARVVVAPLRIARGIQNKVLEAMAMGKPVVASAAAKEGIDADPGREIVLAENEQQFINAVCALLSASAPQIGRAARAKVVARYGWSSNLAKLDELLEAQPAAPSKASTSNPSREPAMAGEQT